ncbi:MAG: 23S rRNA (uracil(1939)-C(5))-methyltransferase RlmD [Sneathiella sp.]|nr:MAG: 23S rRNA (uracil(1939)-C(5))-methyltransferase RlmD [Sneathiella sp.]
MTVNLTIDHIGSSGDGVAFVDEKPVFVAYTAPGDVITAQLGEARGTGHMANLENILEAGTDRIAPACRHFGTCGGCSLQHLSPEFTATWKRQRIIDCLSKVGITDIDVEPTVTTALRSRRRVEFIASRRKKGAMIGYHLRRSHQIFDVGDCPVLHADLLALVKPLRAMLVTLLPRNSQARITATRTDNGPDILITANIELDLAVREILAAFVADNTLSRVSIAQKPGAVAEVIAAARNAEVMLGDVPVVIAPGGFLQATEAGEQALVRRAVSALSSSKNIVDLFAGCGSFSFPLAKTAKVHAVEGDEELAHALQNSANKNILPISTDVRDLFQRPLFPDELKSFDGLLFDPPRAGAQAQAEEIAKSNIETVVAVSCNPVSFSRDVAILVKAGYQLQSLLPVDQFLWSPHVEMIAVLTRE